MSDATAKPLPLIPATQAEMEAMASNRRAVTPANVKYYPTSTVIMACVNTSGPAPVILSSVGLDSVVKNSTGDYTFVFTTAFADNNYVVSGNVMPNSVNEEQTLMYYPGPTIGNSKATFQVRMAVMHQLLFRDPLLIDIKIAGKLP